MAKSEDCMELAFEQARNALASGEVPIGCVFVYKDEIIASGRNTVNETKNATRHAEINALDTLFNYCKENHFNVNDVMRNSVLYVTVEPCIMCAHALLKLGINMIVFGCSNDRFGGCGSVMDLFKDSNISIIKGVREGDAVTLLKDFYKGENPNAPGARLKRK